MQLFLSNDLINSFEANDKRKEEVIWSEWTNNAGATISTQPFSKKYLNGPVVSGDGWDIDWMMLRYDDANSPLRAADDAVLLDTSDLALDEVTAKLTELAEDRGLLCGEVAGTRR